MAELILALDLPNRDRAIGLLDRCPGVRWVKLGPVLFTTAGPALVAELKSRGHRVFLDLKWHDIPNTVAGAVDRARSLGVDLVTVHALGGRAMLEAAKAAAGPALAVVAVTVLTSHDERSLALALGRPVAAIDDEVRRLARLAIDAGLDGVVTAPVETRAVRSELGPGPLIVNPGIRAAGAERQDQARVATAAAAVEAGATHLVVGRPVVAAPDPGAAWQGLVAEIEQCSPTP